MYISGKLCCIVSYLIKNNVDFLNFKNYVGGRFLYLVFADMLLKTISTAKTCCLSCRKL